MKLRAIARSDDHQCILSGWSKAHRPIDWTGQILTSSR